VTLAPGTADIRDRCEQLAGLARVHDDPPVNHLGDLRQLPLDSIERVRRKFLQLDRIVEHVVERYPLAVDRCGGRRRAVKAQCERVERRADVARLGQLSYGSEACSSQPSATARPVTWPKSSPTLPPSAPT
jgi:hypothetical protein